MRRVEGLHDLDDSVVTVGQAEPLACGGGVRSVVPDGLEQPKHAISLLRGADQDRRHHAFPQVGSEIVENGVLGRLDLIQKLLHQLVVVVRQRFEHGEARFDFPRLFIARDFRDLALGVFAVDVSALERQIDRPDHNAFLAKWNLPEQERGAAGRLEQLERIAHARGAFVDLVEEQDARHAEIIELAHDQLQRGYLLFVGFGNNDSDVAGRQNRFGLEREFDGTRTINEGEGVAHEFGGSDGCLDAHLVGARLRRVVAYRAAG